MGTVSNTSPDQPEKVQQRKDSTGSNEDNKAANAARKVLGGEGNRLQAQRAMPKVTTSEKMKTEKNAFAEYAKDKGFNDDEIHKFLYTDEVPDMKLVTLYATYMKDKGSEKEPPREDPQVPASPEDYKRRGMPPPPPTSSAPPVSKPATTNSAEVAVYQALLNNIDEIKKSGLTLSTMKQQPMKYETLVDTIVQSSSSPIPEHLVREKIVAAFYLEKLPDGGVGGHVLKGPNALIGNLFYDNQKSLGSSEENKTALRYFFSQKLLVDMYQKKALLPGYSLYQTIIHGQPHFVVFKSNSVPAGYINAVPGELEAFNRAYNRYMKLL